jgi:hypothetical protein
MSSNSSTNNNSNKNENLTSDTSSNGKLTRSANNPDTCGIKNKGAHDLNNQNNFDKQSLGRSTSTPTHHSNKNDTYEYSNQISSNNQDTYNLALTPTNDKTINVLSFQSNNSLIQPTISSNQLNCISGYHHQNQQQSTQFYRSNLIENSSSNASKLIYPQNFTQNIIPEQLKNSFISNTPILQNTGSKFNNNGSRTNFSSAFNSNKLNFNKIFLIYLNSF